MYAINDFTTELEDIQYSPGYTSELEHRIHALEQQNAMLKDYKFEAERLEMELKHVTTLKDTYEEKYNEASMKLLYIEDDDSLIFSETEQVKTLNQKISILLHANDDLRHEIEQQKDSISRITKERDYFRDQLLEIERKSKTLPQARESVLERRPETCFADLDLKKPEDFLNDSKNYESLIEKPKDLMPEIMSKTSTSPTTFKSPRSSMKNMALTISLSPVARSMNTPKLKEKTAVSRQSPKLKHSKKKSQYIPSFLRKPNRIAKK